MLQQLSLNEFMALSKTAKRVAVFSEIHAHSLTPLEIYSSICTEIKHAVILEDLQKSHDVRYSFIAFDPVATLQVHKDIVTQDINHSTTVFRSNPFTALRHLLNQLSYTTRPDMAGIITSAIGFITYDAIRFIETIPDRHEKDISIPDILLHIYRKILTFDHSKQTLLISVMVDIDQDPLHAYQQAQESIAEIKNLISKSCDNPTTCPVPAATDAVEVDISDNDFIHMVNKAKEYIRQGDAFQIVLSRCFKKSYSAQPLDIYKTLRQLSPAPFMFYLPTENGVIIGASPERLIQVREQTITINPIAGTRKRIGVMDDISIATDLLSDKKEVAEHMMLVDLARNDLGVVAMPGSVQVRELLNVKHYSHVSHITSTVVAKLQNKYDVFDAFTAAFPAGTLSGAPKIRAMQIIDELETSRRGLYGGAICRLDYAGNLDSCIAIRMAVLKEGTATIRAGAGIVHDSDPLTEAFETRQKAQAMLDVIAATQRNT